MKHLTIGDYTFFENGSYHIANRKDEDRRFFIVGNTLSYQLGSGAIIPWGSTGNEGNVWNYIEVLKNLIKTNKENKVMKTLKDYFKKHQEIFLTLGILLLIDYVVFNGALSGKLKDLVEKLIGNVSKKIEALGEGEKDEKLVG